MILFTEQICYFLRNRTHFHLLEFLAICKDLSTSDRKVERKVLVSFDLDRFTDKSKMETEWSFSNDPLRRRVHRAVEAKIPISPEDCDEIHSDSLSGNDWWSQTLSPPSAKSAAAWPSPCNTHFVVSSPSTPTGPRAWIRAVEIPTCWNIQRQKPGLAQKSILEISKLFS